jgi:hypothetical protein
MVRLKGLPVTKTGLPWEDHFEWPKNFESWGLFRKTSFFVMYKARVFVIVNNFFRFNKHTRFLSYGVNYDHKSIMIQTLGVSLLVRLK